MSATRLGECPTCEGTHTSGSGRPNGVDCRCGRHFHFGDDLWTRTDRCIVCPSCGRALSPLDFDHEGLARSKGDRPAKPEMTNWERRSKAGSGEATMAGSARTVRGVVVDQRILSALEAGPATANEIAAKLRREVWEAWADRHGYDFEWETDQEPLGARLLAFSEADEMGLPYLHQHQTYPRLRGLERRGEVERIQIEGRRPMLWQLARVVGDRPARGER